MNIKDIRKKLGLTQRGMAIKMGVSEKSISRWENGHNKPHKRNIDLANQVFGEVNDACHNCGRAADPDIVGHKPFCAVCFRAYQEGMRMGMI
jgi:transcriptional regulator with XRE-family HTH domain